MISPLDVALRLLAALLFCGLVGLQRYIAGKEAGPRTHILVGVGAALFTIISGYAFHTTAANADRIAAQIVSGIGFIGGGAILKEHGSIRGLTTAAGLWAVAALGMAAGAGMYAVGAIGTAIILITLLLLQRIEYRLPRKLRALWLVEVLLPPGVPTQTVQSLLSPDCRHILLQGIEVTKEGQRITLQIEVSPKVSIDDLVKRIHEAGAESVSWWTSGNADHESAV